jgi:polysaccharide pyruvyl transferase WcaK-like protein
LNNNLEKRCTMPNFIMYPHGGSGNHGCEAIVKSTAAAILRNNQETDIILYSANPDQDISYGLDDICNIQIQNSPINKLSLDYIKASFQRHILKDKEAYDKVSYKRLFSKCNKNTIALSIGGDNYCYGQPENIYFMNKNVRRNSAKSVLWGCSVEPDDIDENMKKDLAGYDLIVARESISYKALKKINSNTKLYPDPAFILDKKELPLPEGFLGRNTLGINISPMIMGYEKQNGVTMENYISLINHIIEATDMNIALIPHVEWAHNNDLQPLRELYDIFKESGRVVLIGEGYNCEELKGFIARLRMFIAARTHASIAAYSTSVPTLVVGYSVKARGIARDIFGTEVGYVIPVQALKEKNDLKNAFDFIIKNERSIKDKLQSIMPKYIQRAFDVGMELKKLI